MNYETEIHFVKAYIKKEHQERLIFEFSSPKHREKALSRFSHNARHLLKERFIAYRSLQEAENEIRIAGARRDECYIISGDAQNGRSLPLSEAIAYCSGSYMPVILIGKCFAIIKEETENGCPVIYVMKSEPFPGDRRIKRQ